MRFCIRAMNGASPKSSLSGAAQAIDDLWRLRQNARHTLAKPTNEECTTPRSLDCPTGEVDSELYFVLDVLREELKMLNRDFDHEQETGLCSYCGRVLPITEAPNGDLITCTCPTCDSYEQWGYLEDEPIDNFWDDDDFIASQLP